jgi:orotate phosphoribosyltransferase
MNILETLKELKGFWQYNGGKYLVEDEGKISDVFCNTEGLITKPDFLELYSEGLHKIFRCKHDGLSIPNYICSYTPNSITLGYELARQFGCQAIFTEPKYQTEKCYSPPIKCEGDYDCNCKYINIVKSGQELKFDIPNGATILLAEDVITTGKSIGEMIGAIISKNKNVVILPYILCLINKSMEKGIFYDEFDTLKIISLANVKVRTWDTLEQAQKESPNVIEVINPKQIGIN